MDYDVVISVLANVLYIVMEKRVSVRRAFTSACRKFTCSSRELPRELLFQLVKGFVSDYYKLKYMVEKCGKPRPSYRLLARLYLYLHGEECGLELNPKLKKVAKRDFPNLEKVLEESVEPWVKFSYPKWLYEDLVSLMPREDVERLLEAMNKRVYWIRINTLKTDIDKALKLLEDEGVIYDVNSEMPFLIRVLNVKKPLRILKLFKEGAIVLQDKASVLVVEALKPEPGMLVYDYAAAPGVKASLLMQLTENKARVVAADFSPKRLEVMKELLKFYGVDVSRVILTLADSRELTLEKRANVALIDAPCSSSGAVSKDPAIKIFLRSKELVHKMKNLQVELLYNALNQVDSVVYATCSLLPEEGEEVVEEVLRRGIEQKVVDAELRAQRGYKKYAVWSKVYRTMPHIDMCEGFFIVKFER